MQASCRLLLPVNQGAGLRRRDRLCVSRGSQRARCRQATIIRNATGSSPGGGVLDRPVVLPGEDTSKIRVKVSMNRASCRLSMLSPIDLSKKACLNSIFIDSASLLCRNAHLCTVQCCTMTPIAGGPVLTPGACSPQAAAGLLQFATYMLLFQYLMLNA